MFDACVALCGRAGFTPRIVYEANLMAAVLTLVESGLGASLVPAYVRYLYHEECLLRSVAPASPKFELRMVWRRDSVSPALAAFREIVLHHRADIQKQMET